MREISIKFNHLISESYLNMVLGFKIVLLCISETSYLACSTTGFQALLEKMQHQISIQHPKPNSSCSEEVNSKILVGRDTRLVNASGSIRKPKKGD